MSVDVGSVAPDFTLVDQDRAPVSLSAFRGQPVVLLFFPGAFSSTCTAELCAFRDSQHYTFPLLSDFNKEVIRLYDVFFEDMIGLKGLAKRAVFVIDGAGVIRYKEVLEDARNEPDYDAVFAALASL